MYRIAARVLFAPFGGLARVRSSAVDALQVTAGARILELGCGPGEVTAMLLHRGAAVHAVDASVEMLDAVTRRAPGAHRVQSDIRCYVPPSGLDGVILMFVLHELPVADIAPLMRTVAGCLRPGGRVVVVDHGLPMGARGSLWRRVLHAVESRSVDAWLAVDPASVLGEAGLVVEREELLAGGRARLTAGTAGTATAAIAGDKRTRGADSQSADG